MSVERKPKLQASAPPSELFWLRLHSPSDHWKLQHTVSTGTYSFVSSIKKLYHG